MDISASCRVCFANNVKMHRVIDTPLQELYEKLANIRLTKWWSKAGHPNELCTICYAHLQRCHSFQKAATRAEHLLAQVYLDRVTLTQDVLSMIEQPPVHNYIATSVENVNIYCGTEAREREQIKQEAEIEEDEECQDEVCKDKVHDDTEDASQVKLKLEYESEHSEPIVSAETDSDEDVPLHVLRSTQAKRRTEGEEKEKKKRAYKECKLVAREIILTYEQQKEAMSARASSLNYLNSPHRCTLCFRGFINAETYSNHMEKHLESSGEHVCQLCFMRYRSARLLRAHTHAAHSRQYVCNKCGHTSNTRHQASDHERLHSGEYYECKLCGKSFHLRTSYLTHVRCAHAGAGAGAGAGGAALVCAACGDRYVSEHGLRMHRARAHARNTHEGEGEESPESRYCAACDIQFASRRARHTHILTTPAHWTTHDTKECPICAKVIQTPMTSHMLLHEKELKRARTKPSERPEGAKLNCDQCSLSFASRARLSAHVRRIHLGLKYDKNLVCELCGKKCTSGATLRYHQRTHTGERPHACAAPACGKRFADTNQLRIHTRTHTGERPYACHHCGRRFAQKPALNRHYRVHTGAKPYTCELCTKSFSQSNSLNTHVKAVHLKMANAKKRSRSSYVRKNGSNENSSELTSTVKMDLGE